MIKHFNGNLLDSKCDIIAHQVNLQGVMGGGLARQIAMKYPRCEKEYVDYMNHLNTDYKCAKEYTLGLALLHKYAKNKYIANCFSQNMDFETNYEAVKECFEYLLDFCREFDLSTIGVPYKYGCGIASGDWNKVEQIFKDIFEKENYIELQIWKL